MIYPEMNTDYLSTLTILYVEDDHDAREQLSTFLQRRVGKLITANNGRTGLEAFTNQRPHIVITDIQMSEMDGLTMSQEIRKLDSTVPIIVVTAFEQTDYLLRSIEIGMDKYVTKPVNPDRLHAMLLECADQLFAQKQLRLASGVFDSSQEAIVITDTADIIVSVNRAFTEVTGYTSDEAIGNNLTLLLSSGKQDKAFHDAMWKEILTHGSWRGEIWNKRKNGQIYPEWLSITTLTDAHGCATHYIGIFSDISERKHMEEQLRQSQKMEAIGELAGGVAHDFNNILMVIIGYCDMMKMNLEKDAPQHLDIEQISKAANRAAVLTSGLLAFSRKQIMNPKKTDLNLIISDAGKFLRRIIGEDIRFTTAFKKKTLTVCVDGGQIAQMLMNLATNARDAMQKGGMLAIETSLIELDDSFVMANGYGLPGSYAQIMVSDTGRGMDEKTRLKIFEPFFTTKDTGKGTGLGMAIVYGIIKQHNGYINVYSEPGIGTTFRIYLPFTSEEMFSDQEITVQALPKMGTETILVAEDDPAVREIEASILRKFGYEVILAEDGQDAVKKFTDNQTKIQIILMDMIMPHKNGKQALDEIRLLNPDVKVVFVSGYSADIVRSRGEIDENAELIMKPVNSSELLNTVRNMLDRA
jgi:two-component system, cell cycle sensor histidine kinase and response regulator CckA